jgi:Zn-dependent protease with chaperone function
MTEETTQSLVRRLEALAASSPGTYRQRVMALAALGFGYIILMLLIVVGALVALALGTVQVGSVILVKLFVPLLLVVVAILRAFWVRLPPPTNRAITRRDCPQLWHMMDELRRTLATPPVHEIQIDDNFNAGIAQIPRLGILGWQRNYLTLGLPLLQGLTLDQVRAVVGHELGHLSGNHSRFAGWVYRLRQTWVRLLDAFEQRKSRLGELLFIRFFKWYAPYFTAYSFVMARADEYEADQCAAQVGGQDAARSALVRLEVGHRILSERYWPGVMRRMAEAPEPPGDSMNQVGAALQAPYPVADRDSFIKGALATATSDDDTHPSLTDRLAGLAWREAPPVEWSAEPAKGADAATLLLGDLNRELTDRMSKEWESRNREAWRKRHDGLRKVREEIESLEKASETAPLERRAAWRRVALTFELDPERAFELGQAFVEMHPDDAGGQFQVGLWLLERKDPAGLTHLDRAAELDPDFILPVSQIAADFLTAAGRVEEAAPYTERLVDRARLLAAANEERGSVPRDMILEPSGLAEDELSRLRVALASYRDANEVYLVRRRTVVLPDKPCYLVGVRPRRGILGRPVINEPALIQQLIQGALWPDSAFFVAVVGKNKWLRRRMREMDALLIEQ